MTQETTMTPKFKQYKELKEKHPDCIILFRIGDFYESYDEDATKIGKILGVTVTRLKSNEKGSDGHALKIAGFPYHALDIYLPKIIQAGERVAICKQLDDHPTITEKRLCEPMTDNKEKSKTSENIDTLKAQHEKEIQDLRKECTELKAKFHEQERRNIDVVQRIISESIKALKGELPTILAEYFYSSLGKLEIIKIKNNLNYSLTKDEISYLIGEASKFEKK